MAQDLKDYDSAATQLSRPGVGAAPPSEPSERAPGCKQPEVALPAVIKFRPSPSVQTLDQASPDNPQIGAGIPVAIRWKQVKKVRLSIGREGSCKAGLEEIRRFRIGINQRASYSQQKRSTQELRRPGTALNVDCIRDRRETLHRQSLRIAVFPCQSAAVAAESSKSA